MAEGRGKVQPAEGNGLGNSQLLVDLGEGLKLYMADLDELREQDVNARILPLADHSQLVNNIRNRGRMESVPYCVAVNGHTEIVSGHHRIRAAREAGLKTAPVLIDESGLTRSEIVAKQLAHNRLSGFDDPETLRQLFAMLDNPDDILQSGLAGDIGELPDIDLDKLLVPHISMEWKVVAFTFLPHQLDNLKTLLDMIPPADVVGVADVDQFDPFMEAAIKYSRFTNITNLSMAVSKITEAMLREAGKLEEDSEEQKVLLESGWKPVHEVLQTKSLPPEAAKVISQAIKKMKENEELTDKNAWQALEYWAADYLAGN